MKKLLSLAIFFFLAGSCHAQKAGERITSTLVILYNNSNTQLSILLGEVKMDTFKLRENEVWYSPTYKSNPIIKIQTKGHLVVYKLKLGMSYMIFWDGRKKYWDLIKIESRE